MISVAVALLLFLFQTITGFGLLCNLKIHDRPAFILPLSALLGVAVFSVIPFLLQLAFVPLTATAIFSSLIFVCLLLNLRSKQGLFYLVKAIGDYRWRFRLYELPFLALIVFMFFVSAWRCFYYPPTSRDFTSGSEVIAEYAVKEKTMINSVFTVDLHTTNNQFKPPFLTGLQIIYKYAGFPFGQIWLCTIVACFLVFLYRALSLRLHKAIAGLLLVMFVAIPEMYAYTVMVLFDYSNAVFFFLSVYYLFAFFKSGGLKEIVLSGLLMGIATYVRSETLILAVLLSAMILFHNRKRQNVMATTVKAMAFFLLPSLLLYLLSITVYINFYLPSAYKIDDLLNKNFASPLLLIQRLCNMAGQLLFGNGLNYYGYFGFAFTAVAVLSVFLKKEKNKAALNWLVAVLVVYAGIAFIGWLFPLYDLENTTKRGLFKIFPLMLLFMGNSPFLISVSKRLERWEHRMEN